MRRHNDQVQDDRNQRASVGYDHFGNAVCSPSAVPEQFAPVARRDAVSSYDERPFAVLLQRSQSEVSIAWMGFVSLAFLTRRVGTLHGKAGYQGASAVRLAGKRR